MIASTDKAVEEDKNRFDTGGELAMVDLENKAHYKTESIGVNIGTSISFDGALKPSGSGVGIGSDSGDTSSTTQSGISGSAGNKDVRSDDKETGIDKIFDKDKVLSEIEAQKQITQAFNSLAPKAASDYASSQKSDLMRQAEQETDPEKKQALTDEAQKWGPNGSYNMAMNIIRGGPAQLDRILVFVSDISAGV